MKQKFDFSINTKAQAKMKRMFVCIYIYIHTKHIYTKAFTNTENNQKGYTQEAQTQKEPKFGTVIRI